MPLEREFRKAEVEYPLTENKQEEMVSIPLSKYEELIGYKKAAETLKKVAMREKTYSIARLFIADVLGFDLPQEEEDGEK